MNHTPEHSDHDRDYTDRDIQLGPIVKFAVGIAVFTAAVFAAVAYGQKYLEKQAAAADGKLNPMAVERRLPTEAVLQVKEVADLKAHRTGEAAQLHPENGFEVVDEKAGIFRISIDRAMELTAGTLPVRGKNSP